MLLNSLTPSILKVSCTLTDKTSWKVNATSVLHC